MGLINQAASWLVKKGMGVPAFWFQRGIELGSQEVLSEPYKHSVWVQSAIAKIAGPIASVAPCLYRPDTELAGVKSRKPKAEGRRHNVGRKAFRTSRGVRRKAVEEEISVPVFEDFLREPMAGMGYADFVEASVGWLKLAGECFWLLPEQAQVPFPEVANQRTEDGGRRAAPTVIVARPDKMRHVVENGKLVAWEFKDGAGKAWSLGPEQLIHIKRYNPYDQWRGLSEYEGAKIAAEGDWLAGKFSRNLMANNGDTGPYIVAKNGVPTDTQREQILADLRAKRAAQQRGDFRPIFLTGDIAVEDPKVRVVDSNFIAMRINSREEIFAAFNVPPSLSQVKAAYSIGSASDFYQLITGACIPTGEKFADGLERLCVKLAGTDVEILLDWDEHPVMQEVRKERFASVDTFWSKGMPMEVVNEFLGLEMPEYEGWEVGYLPLAIQTAEMAVAEPEPADNAALAENPDAENRNPNEEEPGEVAEMVRALRTRMANGKSQMAEGQKARKSRNHALWESHMRRRAGTRKLIESKVNRVLNEYRQVALQKLSVAGALTKATTGIEGKSLIDFVFNPHTFGERLVMMVNPVITGALDEAAGQLRKDELGLDDPWKFPPKEALEFVTGRKASIQGCGETVRNQLNTTLSEGIEGGETTAELSDRVRGVFNDLSRGEAKRIASTETGMAFNFARDVAMKGAGIQFKAWLSSHGPKVRPAHAEAEERYGEKAIPMDEPFLVDGEELMYPGDPSGSAGNIINCQCVQLAVAGDGEVDGGES